MVKYVIGLVVIIAVAAGVFVFVGREDNQEESNTGNQQSQTTSPPQQSPSASNTPASTNSVNISNFAFSPTDIMVKKGTTVTWTNNDSVAHLIDFDTDDISDSGNLGNGQNFSATFNDSGTFNYVCGIHPSMHGTVTVTE